MANDWVKEVDIAITVSDKNGKFIEMNDKSLKTFADDGGAALLGSDIMDCHNENSKDIIKDIISEKRNNVYFVEKEGKRKLIYQAPWTINGEFQGLVELSIVIPPDIETKVRG
ncbi:diguanylate cyclase [bacterium BRH_c32]|jgi:transcriptional regulator with PAS, ATPase and Fis domain|nr:MAG: diguanylate cyclase [bacterium BRH_c32]